MTVAMGATLFVIFDAIIMVIVVRAIVKRRGQLATPAGGADAAGMGEVIRFGKSAADEAKRYLEANYSGDPAMLPGVMQGLVNRLAECAREQGMTFDRGTLKHFAGTAVITLKAAKQSEVTAALESVG